MNLIGHVIKNSLNSPKSFSEDWWRTNQVHIPANLLTFKLFITYIYIFFKKANPSEFLKLR